MKLEIESTFNQQPTVTLICLNKISGGGVALYAKNDGMKLHLLTVYEDGSIKIPTYDKKDEIEKIGFKFFKNGVGRYKVLFD